MYALSLELGYNKGVMKEINAKVRAIAGASFHRSCNDKLKARRKLRLIFSSIDEEVIEKVREALPEHKWEVSYGSGPERFRYTYLTTYVPL